MQEWQLTPVFLPGKLRGQRSLVGYSPWDHKESDTTEWLTRSLHFFRAATTRGHSWHLETSGHLHPLLISGTGKPEGSGLEGGFFTFSRNWSLHLKLQGACWSPPLPGWGRSEDVPDLERSRGHSPGQRDGLSSASRGHSFLKAKVRSLKATQWKTEPKEL